MLDNLILQKLGDNILMAEQATYLLRARLGTNAKEATRSQGNFTEEILKTNLEKLEKIQIQDTRVRCDSWER